MPNSAMETIISSGRNRFSALRDQRVPVMRVLTAGAFLLGMAFSSKLWWGDRMFPRLPIASFLNLGRLSDVLAYVLAGSLVGTCLSPRRFFPMVATVTTVLVMAADQMKWQPWAYLYLLMLLPFVVSTQNKHATLRYYSLMLSGVYFWSGIHKLNPQFIDGNFQAVMEFIFSYRFRSPSDPFRLAGYGVGATELLIGLMLLDARFRKLALTCAVMMHAAILAAIVSADHFAFMATLLPWNFAMILFDIAVFYESKERAPEKFSGSSTYGRFANAFVVVAVWILPSLNLWGAWDHYLSFSLFSNKAPRFYIAIEQSEARKVPAKIRENIAQLNGLSGGEIINVDLWARRELGVSFYPQDRTFAHLGRFFCKMDIEKGMLIFLRASGPENNPKIASTSCSELSFD